MLILILLLGCSTIEPPCRTKAIPLDDWDSCDPRSSPVLRWEPPAVNVATVEDERVGGVLICLCPGQVLDEVE